MTGKQLPLFDPRARRTVGPQLHLSTPSYSSSSAAESRPRIRRKARKRAGSARSRRAARRRKSRPRALIAAPPTRSRTSAFPAESMTRKTKRAIRPIRTRAFPARAVIGVGGVFLNTHTNLLFLATTQDE